MPFLFTWQAGIIITDKVVLWAHANDSPGGHGVDDLTLLNT